MGKLPYISDKKMYAAVMGACSWIRDSGYFNRATQYYADRYGVDVAEVRKYVRIAQSNGQKQKNKEPPKRHYLYWAVEYSLGNDRIGVDYFDPSGARYAVRKGLSARTVQNRMSACNKEWSEYALLRWFGRIEGFETEEEAYECVRKWREERDK